MRSFAVWGAWLGFVAVYVPLRLRPSSAFALRRVMTYRSGDGVERA